MILISMTGGMSKNQGSKEIDGLRDDANQLSLILMTASENGLFVEGENSQYFKELKGLLDSAYGRIGTAYDNNKGESLEKHILAILKDVNDNFQDFYVKLNLAERERGLWWRALHEFAI